MTINKTILFGWIQKIINFVFRKREKPLQTEGPSWSLYSTLEIPLTKFIKCLLEADLRALIIEGQPNEEDLLFAWGQIYEAYCKAMGGKDVEVKMLYAQEYQILAVKVAIGEMVLELIDKGLFHEVMATIKQFGYPIPEKITDVEQAVKVFRGNLNKDGLHLDRLKAMLTKDEEEGETKNISRSDFTKMLTHVSLAFKTPLVRIEDISTEQYVELVNEYIRYCRDIEEQNNKIRSR